MIVVALFLLGPIAFVAGPAMGVHIVDFGILNNTSVKEFEVRLGPSELYNNTTLYLPINASALVTKATINVTGSQDAPDLYVWANGGPANFGAAVDGGADFNGDGFGDLAVGAPGFAGGRGQVFVFFGSPALGNESWDLDNSPDWASGTGAFGWTPGLGVSVSHGDFNGDGHTDLVAGARACGLDVGCWSQGVYVFLSNGTGLSVNADYVLWNESTYREWGADVVGNLDLNGDGFDELLVTETDGGAAYQGSVVIVWGSAAGLEGALVDELNFTRVTVLEGDINSSYFGGAIGALGDTDGDGLDEFAVTSEGSRPTIEVFEGIGGSHNLSRVWNITRSNSDYLASAVAGGYDLVGDGKADLAVSVFPGPNGDGEVELFNGTGNASYSALVGATIPKPASVDPQSSGADISIVPDFDGNGIAELLVGYPEEYNTFGSGSAYLYEKNSTTGRVGSGSEVFHGWGAYSSTGTGVRAAGDLNGDGYQELALPDVPGFSYGVDVLFGSAHPSPENVTLTVASQMAASFDGPLAGSHLVEGLVSPIQDYLAIHASETNATGYILVPLSFNFSYGGRLNVSDIFVKYSVVPTPTSVSVRSPAVGGCLVVSWDSSSSDVDLFSVWSNKSGDWSILANISAPLKLFNDTNVTDGTRYWYRVRAWDSVAGLQGGNSSLVSGIPRDLAAPAVPQLTSVVVDQGAHSVDLLWSPNLDDTTTYEIWRKDSVTGTFDRIGTVTVPGRNYRDSGLSEETTYAYRLRAVDDAGLLSGFSEETVAFIPDITAPPAPTGLVAASEPSGTAIRLTWTANGGDTVAYEVSWSASNASGTFSAIGTSNQGSFTDAGLARNLLGYYRVVAIDRVGLRSPPTDAVEVVTVDQEPPAAPVLLSAQPIAAGNAIELTWSASADDIGAFRVYFDDGNGWVEFFAASATSRSAIVNGLADGRATRFKLVAFDTSGFQSADSRELVATPGDSLPPAAPGRLSVTAPETGAEIDIEWSASLDADVSSYTIYVLDPAGASSFTALAKVSATVTSFRALGLRNGLTYSFQVSASDEVPNESPPSSRVTMVPRDFVAPTSPVFGALPSVTNGAQLALRGAADPGASVEIRLNGVLSETVTANEAGEWQAIIELAEGSNTITVRAVDPLDSESSPVKYGPWSREYFLVVDTRLPFVVASRPLDGSYGAGTADPIIVSLSELVEPNSIRIYLQNDAGNVIPGTSSYDAGKREVRFTPASPLAPNTHYSVHVEARDFAGNQLAPISLSFTTEGGYPVGLIAAGGLGILGAVVVLTPRGEWFLANSLWGPWFTRLRKDDVKNQYHRGRLIQLITDAPGIGYMRIRRSLRMSNGACAYHLRVLERSGEVRRVSRGASVRFYAASHKFEVDALPPLAFFQRRILRVILEGGELRFGEIGDALRPEFPEVKATNLAYHLKVLARDKEVIATRREAGRAFYFVPADRREGMALRLGEEDAADRMLEKAEREPQVGGPRRESEFQRPLAGAGKSSPPASGEHASDGNVTSRG